jgi:hypothetical protein
VWVCARVCVGVGVGVGVGVSVSVSVFRNFHPSLIFVGKGGAFPSVIRVRKVICRRYF